MGADMTSGDSGAENDHGPNPDERCEDMIFNGERWVCPLECECPQYTED